MAVWSKALPLTAHYLSPLLGFESQPGYSGFLHYLQLASHKLATIGINVTKKQIPNPKIIAKNCSHFSLVLLRTNDVDICAKNEPHTPTLHTE